MDKFDDDFYELSGNLFCSLTSFGAHEEEFVAPLTPGGFYMNISVECTYETRLVSAG